MGDWLKSALEVVKLPLRWLWPLAIATGILVFAPSWLLTSLGLTDLVSSYRGWIGLAFLIVAALLGAGIVAWVGEVV
jgi:hypothetical protein